MISEISVSIKGITRNGLGQIERASYVISTIEDGAKVVRCGSQHCSRVGGSLIEEMKKYNLCLKDQALLDVLMKRESGEVGELPTWT